MISPSFIDEDRVQRWCRVIADAQRPYFSGGIFPRELAVFLAACDQREVDCIVESGRQDGYSTSILADYAAATGTTVASIDIVLEPTRDAAARRRLADTPVRLIDGNVFEALPEAIPATARRVALLIDGPKGLGATNLLRAATATFPVVLAACHGWRPETTDGQDLLRRYPDTAHAELGGEAFEWFRTWERSLIEPYLDGMRPLDRSTLAVTRVPPRRVWAVLPVQNGRDLADIVRYIVRRLRRQPVGRVPPAVIARAWRRRASS